MQPCMARGRRVAPEVPLLTSRAYAAQQLAALPVALRALEQSAPYPVTVSNALQDLARAADALTAQASPAATPR